MEYPRFLETGGDLHLFVTLTGGSLNCILVQANYDAGISDSDVFSMSVPEHFSMDNFDLLLGNVLKEWSREIGWDLVKCRDELCLLSLDGSESVKGTTLIVDKEYLSEGTFHSFVLGVDAIILDDQAFIDMSAKLYEISEAESFVLVVADWDVVRVLVVARGKQGFSHEGKVLVRELKLEGDALDNVIETSMEHVLSVHMRKDALLDVVSNLRDRKGVYASSEQVQDVVRSYLTAALIHVRDASLLTFGLEEGKNVLCATGPIIRLLEPACSSLALIDGLQLRGRFEVDIDSDLCVYAGGVAYVHRRFAFPFTGLFQQRYLYISTERGASGRKGQTAFRGKYIDDGGNIDDERLIIGQTGHIVPLTVGAGEKVLIEPAKPVYFPNLEIIKIAGKPYFFVDEGGAVGNVVVDCRLLPIVYGPDANANRIKVFEWKEAFRRVFREKEGIAKK